MMFHRVATAVLLRRRPRVGLRLAAFWLGLMCSQVASAADVLLAFAPGAGSLPIYVAQEQGLFAAEGVSVRAVDCKVGKECMGLMLAGKAHIATAADLPIVLSAFAGARLSIVATMTTNRNDTKIVTRRSSNIRTTQDLSGRRVGTVLGTTAQYALDSQLLVDGVDPFGVQLVDLPLSELHTALVSGRVDAIAVFEPWAFELIQALGNDALVMSTKRTYTQTWNLVVPPLATDRERAELAAVLRALRRACEWIAKEPDQARALARKRLGVRSGSVDASWSSLTFRLDLTQSLLTTLEAEARWALRRGLVTGAPPDFLGYIDASVLRSVHAGAVTLVK